MITNGQYIRLKALLPILKEVQIDYSGKTIDNIIQQIDRRIKEVEK